MADFTPSSTRLTLSSPADTPTLPRRATLAYLKQYARCYTPLLGGFILI